jgi:5'-3' exonuclease
MFVTIFFNKIEKKKDKNIIIIYIMNIVLVDTSYTSFYRFFATLRWYTFAHSEEYKKTKEIENYDWIENKIFLEKYEKMYHDSIIKLLKKKIYNNSKIIFCMDSPKEKLWRTQIYCDYKSDRMDLSIKNNYKSVFEYTYNTIIPNLIKNNQNIYSIRVNKIEADDIIAIISNYMKNKKETVYIISGDEDFLQLGRDNLIFLNYKSKKPLILTEEEAQQALLKKIIFGDNSDCIKSIIPKGKRINKKKLLDNKELLIDFLENNEESKNIFNFNKKLIDFNFIPKKYVSKVIELFKNL